MKCQTVKRSKNTQQMNYTPIGHLKDKGNFLNLLAQQDGIISEHHLKRGDNILYEMGEETHNVRIPKPSGCDVSPRSSPTLGSFYAGAKFSGAPSPTDLPKPPSRWTMAPIKMASGGIFPLHGRGDKHHDFASQLKMLINAPV